MRPSKRAVAKLRELATECGWPSKSLLDLYGTVSKATRAGPTEENLEAQLLRLVEFIARDHTAGFTVRRPSVKQALRQSKLLTDAIQEALDFDPVRHHNLPPPPLRVENPEYLEELRRLRHQLELLNISIEHIRRPEIQKEGAIRLHKYVDTFLSNYAPMLGKGTALLTIGAIAGLLHSAGLTDVVVDAFVRKFRP